MVHRIIDSLRNFKQNTWPADGLTLLGASKHVDTVLTKFVSHIELLGTNFNEICIKCIDFIFLIHFKM